MTRINSTPPRPDRDLAMLRAQLVTHIRVTPALSAASDEPAAAITPAREDGLWADIDYASAPRSVWPARRHIERARALAVAGLRERAIKALGAWLARDPKNPNWWHNQIGAPRLVGEILILLGDDAPPALLDAAGQVFARCGDYVHDEGLPPRPMRWTGANLIWFSINRLLAAALRGDDAAIRAAVDGAMSEVRVASGPGEEGIQPDFSFQQHGPLLYNGGYGEAFLSDTCYFIAAARGTRWEPGVEKRRVLADLLLEGTRWMLRGEDVNPGCRDREMTRPRAAEASAFARAADVLAAALPERAAELLDLAAAIRERRAPGTLRGNRHFPCSDLMVQHEADAGYSVRMHSSRTLRGECCNDEGLLSHHVADGLTYLVRRGDEYRGVFPVWDWQKLPGTTVAQTACDEPRALVRQRGGSDAVAGVSDGEYGVCAQQLFHNSLAARKAWFFGPSATMHCLGADIHSGHGSVVTTLDQSPRQGAVEHDAAPAPLVDGRHDVRGARWLRHGPWLFAFPAPTDLVVESGPRDGAWSRIGAGPAERVTRDVFLAFVEHGPGPAGAGYAYSVRPYEGERAGIVARLAATEGVVLENSARAQAVWWPAAGLLQAVFWHPGEIALPDGRRLRSAGESILQLHRAGDGWAARAVDLRQRGEPAEFALIDAEGRSEPLARSR